MQEGSAGDREPGRGHGEAVDESTGQDPGADPQPGQRTEAGEYVGRAQPIDQARQEPRPPGGAAPRPVPGPDRGSDPPAAPPPQRPAAPRGSGPASRPAARRQRAASVVGAVDRVRRTDFPVVLRGYDRTAVDAYVAEVAQLVAELEATQLPETVVQRALDEVGDETSAILKRAHEAAEQIAARSRSQAESRIQRAEHEAELTRREAEDQVRALEDDIQAIWRERQRLIEDVRQLADDVLALADDAIERIPVPGVGEGEEPSAEGAERDEPSGEEPAEGEDQPERGAVPPLSAVDPDRFGDESADAPTIESRPSRAEDEDTAERPGGGSGA